MGFQKLHSGIRRIYHPIAIFVCSLLPHDSNWSISRVYVGEINNYLCCKSKLNGINFINHTDWTFQDGSLKPNLFYANKLHLIEEGNAKLAASIYNSINPNASNINEIVSVSSIYNRKISPCYFVMCLFVILSVILISPL